MSEYGFIDECTMQGRGAEKQLDHVIVSKNFVA